MSRETFQKWCGFSLGIFCVLLLIVFSLCLWASDFMVTPEITKDGQGISFHFPSGTDVYFQVWASDSLTGQWTEVRGMTLGAEGAQSWSDAAAIASFTGLYYRLRRLPLSDPDDYDGDGIDDVFELRHPDVLNPLNSEDAVEDADDDGLTNYEEYFHNTNLLDSDTDGDGLSDKWEVMYGLSPLDPTDAWIDTDNDGFLNIYEYLHGSDPTQSNSAPLPTIYVSESGRVIRDGSETSSFGTIQAAIDAAKDYDIIQLASGLYLGEGNRNLDFRGKLITVISSDGAATCIVDCQGLGRGVFFSKGEDHRTVLRGITIRNGDSDKGAGIRCAFSGPTIVGCVIESNKGFGVYIEYSEAQFIECVVQGNTDSGIIFREESTNILTRCIIRENHGDGVICFDNTLPTLQNCLVTHNDGDGVGCADYAGVMIQGGELSHNRGAGLNWYSDGNVLAQTTLIEHNDIGVLCYGLDVLAMTNVTIRRNRDSGLLSYSAGEVSALDCSIEENEGAGVVAYFSSLTIRGCRLRKNRYGGVAMYWSDSYLRDCMISENDGEGVFSYNSGPVLANCVIEGNQYAGILCDSVTDAMRIENCSIINSQGTGLELYDSFPVIRNTIAWGNSNTTIEAFSCSPAVTYSCIEGGWEGIGNIDSDPLFVRGSFRLSKDSPCVDAGMTNDLDMDISGEPRILVYTNRVSATDIGADEFVDADGDGIADEWEIEQFGYLSCDGADDLDEDGLSNREEYENGTSPWTWDSDGDGLSDGDEVKVLFTCPLNPDTDGDLVSDGVEVSLGFDPLDPNDIPPAFIWADDDEDGYSNIYELWLGTDPANQESIPAPTIFVDGRTEGRGDGSRAFPFATIQSALSAAVPYDIIEIADGVYTGFQNRDLDSLGKPVMLIPGGPQGWTVDCQNMGRGFIFHSGEDARTIIRGVTIRNGKGMDGAGIRCVGSSSPVIENAIIEDCHALWNGGGVYSGSGVPVFRNCVLRRNSASEAGGGASLYGPSAQLVNCTIIDNVGGGVEVSYSSTPVIQNCIIWGNSPTQILVRSFGTPTVMYSCVEGGWTGLGNIDSSLQFVRGCFRLTRNSPCIDAGIANSVPKDFDGEMRTLVYADRISAVDMGADEFVDSDADGMADLWEMQQFGSLSYEGNGDEDEDGLTNREEYENKTDPWNPDTDSDGLRDGGEVKVWFTCPLSHDTDGDYLGDGWEIMHGMNPLVPLSPVTPDGERVSKDTDRDGYPDLYEMIHGGDSSNAIARPHYSVFVSSDASTRGDGSADNPFNAIQPAIDAACNYSIIHVAPGVYSTSQDLMLDLKGKRLMVIAPAGCVIDGRGIAYGFHLRSNEDVFSIIRGFTIRGADVGIRCESSSSPQIQNCLLMGNFVTGIECRGNAAPTIENCTIVRNGMNGLVSYEWAQSKVRNCIIWSNPDGQIVGSRFPTSVTYSCIEDGWPQGVGNIALDPKLNPSSGRLTASSPCIDRGMSNSLPTDCDGEARVLIYSTRVSATDIGADEFVDADNDGMPDAWEMQYFAHLNQSETTDYDNDGLSDVEEYENGTDPINADTDRDGLWDGSEVHYWGTSPLLSDTDGDGLLDRDDPDPTASLDSDRDGLPDSWEIHQFSNLHQTVFTDFDSDGLTDGQEYLAGTNPRLSDTDGDGIGDFLEVSMAFSDPLVVDYDGTVSDIFFVPGASCASNKGDWAVKEASLFCRGRHGWVDYTLHIPSNGFYVVAVDVGEHGLNSALGRFDLALFVDGVRAGRQVVRASPSMSTTAQFFLPRLAAGPHTVRVRWYYGNPRSELQINRVRLQALGGPDNNNNGAPDWIDHRMDRLIGVPEFMSSIISPACVMGTSPALNLLSASNLSGQSSSPLPLHNAVNGSWYTDLPLSPTGLSSMAVWAECGVASRTCAVSWARLNLLDGHVPSLCIREGDALLLTAFPADATNGTVYIEVPGVTNYLVDWGESVMHAFTTTGRISVVGRYDDGVISLVSNLDVNVLSASLHGTPACVIRDVRRWECKDLSGRVTLQHDLLLDASEEIGVVEGERQFSLKLAVSESQTIVLRAGHAGPLFTNIAVQGFAVYSSGETHMKHVGTYWDGSRAIETLVVMEPVIPDVTIRFRIIFGGATFEDGTVVKDIKASHFNELGEYRLRAILPRFRTTLHTYPVLCHVRLLYQNGEMIGGR